MARFDAGDIFAVNVSPLELFVRGTLMYLFLLFLFRFVVRRRIGGVLMSDILLMVVISDIAQNAFTDDYHTVSEGCIVVGTVIFWNVFLDWLGFKSARLERILEPPPLPLIKNREIVVHNLRKEFITENELRAKLREKGIFDVNEVEAAWLESDGHLTVKKREEERKS